MLEDALLEVAQEDKYGKAEIANAGEILRVLRGEVDAEAFEEWVRRAVIFLQSKKVLLSWLHGEDEDGELQAKERENRKGTSKENHATIALRGLWEEWQNASTPHRRKPAEQLARKLDKALLELSRETASVEKFMCCVRIATKGEGFMPEALSADAENAERATLYEPMSALEENWAESSVKNALRAGASKSSHAVVLRGDSAESGTAGQGAADNAEGSVGGSSVWAIDHVITTGGNCTAQGPCVYENIAPTEKAAGVHAVCYPIMFKERAGCPGGGKGILCGDKPFTLSTLTDQAVCYPVDLIRESRGAFEAYEEDAQAAGSLKQCDNKGSQVVCYALQGNGIDRADTAGCNGAGWREGIPTHKQRK